MEYVHISAKEGYKDDAVSHYEAGRPGYPAEVVRTVLNGLNKFPKESTISCDQPFRILELGAGTGKFTRNFIPELQGKNVELIVSEPLPSMCDKLKEAVPDNVKVLQSAAQILPLENESVDAVIAVQCFHWFSDKKALNEIARVLRRGSTMAVMWMIPDTSISWIAEQEKIIAPYWEIHNTPRQQSWQWKRDLEESQLFSLREKFMKDVEMHTLNVDGLIRRLLSISVIASQSSEEKEKIASEFRSMFMNHPDIKGKEFFPFARFAEICWCDKI